MASVQEVSLNGWHGLKLEEANTSLVACPEPGGRILSFAYRGEEILFVNPSLSGPSAGTEGGDVREVKRRFGWRHFGGSKTWLAPQEHWTDGLPFFDLDSGVYELAVRGNPADQVMMMSPVDRESGMQVTRTISVPSDGVAVIELKIANRGGRPATWGIWEVTQVRGPGVVRMPLSETSRYPHGVKAYAGEGRSVEAMRRYVRFEDGLAVVICDEVEPFKYGADSTDVWIEATMERAAGSLSFRKTAPQPTSPLPHEASVEVFDSGELPYFEIETHSGLYRLAPGESASRTETWTVSLDPT